MSQDDRDPQLVTDGLRCQARNDRNWIGGRASVGVASGRFYYEASFSDEGLSRLGWSTAAASFVLGTDKQSFGFGGTGKKSHQNQFDDYGQQFGKGDVLGCCIDLQDEYTISFVKNGVDLGVAFEIPKNLRGAIFYPAITLKNADLTLNFGPAPLNSSLPVPRGYKFVNEARVSQTSVGVASAVGSTSKKRIPSVIIVEPTRELAEQVYQEIDRFKVHLTHPSIRQVLLVGGVDNKALLQSLSSDCDIVVGTCGKIMDMMNSGKLDLSGIQFFILDEADRLLDGENTDMIMRMYRAVPKGGPGRRLQVLLFSATLHSPEITTMSQQITHNAIWVDLKGKDAIPDTVHHAKIIVDPHANLRWGDAPTDGVHACDGVRPGLDKPEAWSEGIKKLKLQKMLEVLKTHDGEQCIIFCRTKVDCDNVEDFLIRAGGGRKFAGKVEKGVESEYSCAVLHGDRSPQERRSNLAAFKEGDVRLLVCTDVAARGIDVQELPFVINMTLPDRPEDYLHRIGRCGRAETMGLAVSLVGTDKEKVWYHTCASRGRDCSNTRLVEQGGCCIWYDETAMLKAIEQRIQQPIPTLEDFLAGQKTGVVYGQSRQTSEISHRMQMLVESLRPSVRQLAELENESQDVYWKLKMMFQ